MATVADMFNFDSVADEDAQQRRAIVSDNTNAISDSPAAGTVRSMMQVADNVPPITPASVAIDLANALKARGLGSFTGSR